jgi:hypothetical protein
VDKSAHLLHSQVGGVQGLTKEQQIERVEKALRVTTRAQEFLIVLLDKVKTRDFEAYKAAKDAAEAAENGSVNDDDDEDESAF